MKLKAVTYIIVSKGLTNMIIKRRFVPFHSLVQRDSYGRNVFYNAFEIDNPNDWESIEERKKEHISILFKNSISLDTADMSCCIPNIEYIYNEFEKLDLSNPYDNALSLSDVNRVEIVYKEDDIITLCLINDSYGESHIVGFTNLNYEPIENPNRWGNYGDWVFNKNK